MEITFSSDTGKITKKDGEEVGKIMEEYFKTLEDSEQATITEERARWLREKLPESINIIKTDNKVIGASLILPCTKKLMNLFISKNINEEELFEAIQKNVTYNNLETIYLCSSIIVPEFRKRGLASQAVEKSIKKMLSKNNIKPILFAWSYSKEGVSTAKKIARDLRLELKERI